MGSSSEVSELNLWTKWLDNVFGSRWSAFLSSNPFYDHDRQLAVEKPVCY